MALSSQPGAARCLLCRTSADNRLAPFCSWLCRAAWVALHHAYALEGPASVHAEVEPLLARLADGEPLSTAERKRLYAWLLRIERWRARVTRQA